MWIFTKLGAYSIVKPRFPPYGVPKDAVCVRARVKKDLVRLLHGVGPYPIEHTPKADYAWRAYLPMQEWELLAQWLAGEVDYPNFKDEVKRRQGEARERAYHDVWASWLASARKIARRG